MEIGYATCQIVTMALAVSPVMQIKYFLLSGGGFGRLGGGSGNSQLVSWIEAHTTQVPASTYGGSTSGGTLYAVTSATLSATQP